MPRARTPLAVAAAFLAVAADRRPNVVFILADDLGVNDLGCYGRADHCTPNLDKLAAAGARLTAAYAACPVCSPTRAALMTGLSPARLHLTTFLPGRPDCPSQKLLHPKIETQLPAGTKTIADHLKAAGYATGAFGKWHLGSGPAAAPTAHGFDVYFPGKANTTPSDTEGGKGEFELTDRAIEFIAANKHRPFFCYLPHNIPHIPYAAKPELVTKNAAAFEPTYAAVIESMDASVGRLLAKLDELKLTDNTVVVFTSDNGGLHVPEGPHAKVTHNTPYRAGKGFLYEGGIRVPAIVRFPGKVPAGTVVDTPVITTDWPATLLEWCGVDAPATPDGASVAKVIEGTRTMEARPLYWHVPHSMNQGSRPAGAVRLGEWKLIQHYEDGQIELFNLKADPGEATDVAATDPAYTTKLAARLQEWKKAVGAQEMAKNPAFDAALHRKLYVDVDPSKYDPLRASPAEFERMQEWRKGMNAAVPKGKKGE